MRVERYLAIKDRPLTGMEDRELVVELTYPNDVTTSGKYITVAILLTLNAAICSIPYSLTSIIVTLVGAFTSPLVIFVIPGYLFYNYASKNETNPTHKYLSLALTVIGVVLLIVMTTISFFVIRIDTFPNTHWTPPSKESNIEL